METLFTINQVAFILKVHQLTVRRFIREQKLPAIKVGGSVRVKENDLEKFQTAYTLTKKEPRQDITKEGYVFKNTDPFWRLNGLGAHLTLPEND